MPVDLFALAKKALVNSEYDLDFHQDKLSLLSKNDKPFAIDFLSGKNQHRRLYPSQGETVIKACLAKDKDITILDLTAGLGRDAFMLASLGAKVSMVERSPVMAALLDDALIRLKKEHPFFHLNLRYIDALTLENEWFDVVYLDPMHPPRKSKALVKKDIRMVQSIVGQDNDKGLLFDKAFQLAQKRVVLKWPVKVLAISDRKPSFIYCGKSTNFEIYLTQKNEYEHK